MKLAHISDIHFRGIARHKEYTECFKKLFQDLRDEVKPDYIICTGDWFHTKTVAITPEIIEKLTWVFRELSSIAPLIGILGNHDGNLANEDRQDTITPIAAAINSPRVRIFKKTGVYEMPDSNLRVGVLSPFDKSDWDGTMAEFLAGQQDDKVSICLYHGSVTGCQTDSDWIMTKGAEQNMSYFEGIDFGLFGDIHQCQFLSFRADFEGEQKPNVAYPGSLIQQNHGESRVKGYLVWNIRSRNDWDVEFRRLENSYGFLTVQWRGTVFETTSAILQEFGQNLAGKSIRILSRNTIFDVQKTELTNQLRSQHKAAEVVFRFEKKRDTAATVYSDGEVEDEDLFNSFRPSAGNPGGVSMQETVTRALRKYIAANQDSVHVVSGSATEKAMIDLAVAYYNKLTNQNTEDVRDVVWSLKNMVFSNLYSFGEDNVIDFSKMRGITGIFGANASGKSSIIGAMMFGLFNTTDRGPVKAAHIINRTKTAGSVEILFNVAGTDYVLRREVAKSRTKKGIDHDKAAGKLYLARVDMSGNEIELNTENAETRNDTDKVIRNLIGSSQDYLMTGLAAQGEMNRFIKEGATARKQMISRFLDLKVYEDIFKLANDDLNALNARSQRFKGVDFNAKILHLCSDQSRLEAESSEIKEDIAALEEELAEVKAWLLSHNSSRADEIVARKSKSDKSLDDAQRALINSQTEFDVLETRVADLGRRLSEKNRDLGALEDEAALLQKKELFQALNVKLMAARSNETLNKTLIKKHEESVKRLKLVPCGDQYLDSCKYISGAKEDREQLEKTTRELAEVVASIEAISDEINKLHAENVEAAIKQRQALQRDIADINAKIETSKNEREFKLRMLEACVERLNGIRNDHAEISREHDLLLSNIQEIAGKQSEQKQLQAELLTAKEELQKNTRALGAISNQLLVLEQDKLEAEKLLSEQKFLDAICVAFSKNAIPAMVIESALPYVNAELDNILGGVAPFRVYLKTEVGNSNVLDVYIEDDDSPRVIELASGMEKMIASLALRVALINLSRLPKPDFLVIDEGWDVLDGINVSRAIDLLNSLKTKFKNILVISHVDALKEAADDFITIQNNSLGKSSYVNY